MFKSITCKLGNMRKATRFTLCPQSETALNEVIIQSDRRIARIDLNTGKAILSSGKASHPGFIELLAIRGAVTVDVPADVLAELNRLTATNTKGDGIGTIKVVG